MYKISFNDKVIKLAHIDLESHLPPSTDDDLKVVYPGKVKYLHNYLDKLEKNQELRRLYILYHDVKQLKKDFFSIFKILPAAGGLVLNNVGQTLFIFRRGHWDLPKGKMEVGETKKVSALREVMEETGLKKVRITQKLMTTYHIYRGQNSNRRILKPSYWYLMYSRDVDVVPQQEEDIERVEWKKLDAQLISELRPIYSNIKDVLVAYLAVI